jgi:hypothetical protein
VLLRNCEVTCSEYPIVYNIDVPLVFLEVSRHEFMKIVDKDVKNLNYCDQVLNNECLLQNNILRLWEKNQDGNVKHAGRFFRVSIY